MLFDQLFDAPNIPIAVKGLIGRMQIPMLKVAIADKAFFSKKSHPARRLLDTLGEMSSRLPADFNASNPLFGHLEAIIQELMNNFQDSTEIFDVVRERLQILVEEEDRRVEQETQAAAKRIERNESLAASKTMAEFEIKARVEAGKLPRPVIEFLVYQWVKPLLIVHVRRGQHSDAWKNSLATMDLLIWSVEAKHTSEECRKLATVVPDLLKRLAAGLKIADVEDAIRERFFSDLNELHAEAMSMAEEGGVAEAHDASAENHPAKPDAAPAQPVAAPITRPVATSATRPAATPATKLAAAPAGKPVPEPKKIVQPIPATASKAPASIEAQGADSDSLDFTKILTIKNPFGGGKVSVEELESADVRAAVAPHAKGAVNEVEFINNLKEGTWVEFREKGAEDTHRPAKLSYISPLRSSFLFIDQLGKTVKECSRTELGRLVRLGMVAVVVVDEAPLFDRMMAGVIDKLR